VKYYRGSEKSFRSMIDTHSGAFDINVKCLVAQHESRKRVRAICVQSFVVTENLSGIANNETRKITGKTFHMR